MRWRSSASWTASTTACLRSRNVLLANSKAAICGSFGGRRYEELWRWHQAGRPVIYASTSIALAALEYAVHTAVRPADTVLLTMELPADSVLKIDQYLEGPLPGNWAAVEAQTQHIGTEWLTSNQSIALEVPSVVIPLERNLILNPSHPRFSEVRTIV
jgi:RES domain-containing protein